MILTADIVCMETTFWHVAVLGGLITWTACTFLRAVAARTKQLREQLTEQIDAVRASRLEKKGDMEDSLTPGMASVVSVREKPKPHTNGIVKPANGNGHANGKNGRGIG